MERQCRVCVTLVRQALALARSSSSSMLSALSGTPAWAGARFKPAALLGPSPADWVSYRMEKLQGIEGGGVDS